MSATCLPALSELAGVFVVPDLLQVLHVSDPLWQAWTAQVGDPGNHLRFLAALPKGVVVQGCVQALLPSGEALSAVQAAQVGLVWRTSRKLVHHWSGADEASFVDVDPWHRKRRTS